MIADDRLRLRLCENCNFEETNNPKIPRIAENLYTVHF